ncbi:hypothetical protein KP803_12705 [Vibrio sp. ZSDE26]|uniref:Thrombospondin n=1 Tax=Vibrio amylolyticus TaxID=2847292 RepID=A0A9X1XJ11_9VIBR|nr:hypothetical protein [Vibrio amylolyticus]MCK6264132.1 hypothetical protein [Vibrio amylolyticus]
MKAYNTLFVLGLVGSLSLFGCGDSGSASSSSPSPLTPESGPTETYTVRAIDGYLKNAQVWLDLNGDGIQDDDEPSTLSGEGGVANLDISNVLNPELYSVVVQAIAGQTIDEDSDGTPIAVSYVMSAPAGEVAVTPLSTYVHLIMQESLTSNSSAELIEEIKQQAIIQASGELGIAEDEILGDFVEQDKPQAAFSAMSIVKSGQILPETPQEMQQLIEEVANDPTSFSQKAAAVNEKIRKVVAATPVEELQSTPPPINRNDDLVTDSDQDGIPDLLDAFPADPNEFLDSDGDGIGNVADLNDDVHSTDDIDDGYPDDTDRYPTDPNRAGDHDGDGIDSLTDARPYDFDNDGYDDADDEFPKNALLAGDHDGDGFDSLNDEEPNNSNIAGDHDGDGYDSANDAFPLNDLFAGDHDGDGFDSVIDQYPDDATKAGDHDGDTFDSVDDAFPQDITEWLDSDGDSVGDNSDIYPFDFDNDSYADDIDAFPQDATEWVDTDGDNLGNNADPDDDNDGYDDLDDNDPLVALVTPDTYSACLTSLPDYPIGSEAPSRSDGRLYEVSRLNVEQSNVTHYFQTELYVETIDTLPSGHIYQSGNQILVNQITTDFGANPVNEWDPNLEFEYIDASTGEFIGYRDHYDRWWGYSVLVNRAETLPLNEAISWSVERNDKWSLTTPTAHDQLTMTYLGKEIISTELGLRELCVTHYQGEFDFVKTADSAPETSDMYLEDSVKNYVDKNEMIQRAEREYLEYDPSDKTVPTWGYTNYVKQLKGFISNELLYGQDPITANVPSDQPVTLDECLSGLPTGVQPPTRSDSLSFDIVKRKLDGTVQYGVYHWDLLTADNVAWQDKTELFESRLTGEIFVDGHSLGVFTERYYEDSNGVFQGMEAREQGSDEVKWGSVHLDKRNLTLESTYRIPEVESTHVRAVNADTQYGDWHTGDYVTNTMYVGKEAISYQSNGQTITQDACRVYTSNQGSLFDGSDVLSASESMQQVNWYDNNGLVLRESENQEGTFETWTRSAVNGAMPVYTICELENTGEVFGSADTYQDFVPAAQNCSYRAFDSVMLVDTTLYHQESDSFYYSYHFNGDGTGVYSEPTVGHSENITWHLNSDGILEIKNGTGNDTVRDDEYFALIASKDGYFSLIGFYVWQEEGTPASEIIGQEFSTNIPDIGGGEPVLIISELFDAGLTWLWAESSNTGAELEFGTIGRNPDNSATETYSEFDYLADEFITEVVTTENAISDDRYVLESNGTWELENEAITQIVINPDNTLDMMRVHGGGFTNTVLSATEIPLADLNIASLLTNTDEGGSWAKFVSDDATFTPMAKGYTIEFSNYEYFTLETLSWWCDGLFTQEQLGGMCNHILTSSYQPVINFAALEDSPLIVTWNQSDSTEIIMQLNSGGLVSFTNEAIQLESGSWESLTVNGTELIKVQAPLSVAQVGDHFAYDGSLYFAEFMGFVRRVRLDTEGGNELFINSEAQTEVLNAFESRLTACSIDNQDDGVALLLDLQAAVTECNGSGVITEEMLIGRTLTIDYPDPHSEYMTLTFNGDGSVDGMDVNTYEGWRDSWTIEGGYLKMFSGNWYVYWALVEESKTQWSVKLLEQWEDDTDPHNVLLKQFITSGVAEYR